MIKPEVLRENADFIELATIFDAPLGVVPHISAFPWIEVVTAAGFTYWSKSRRPDRPWQENLVSGLACMLASLGSEWAHNLAHALIAKLVQKPVDAIRVVFGMPLLHYQDLNDETVSPRQHILRASGGPALNLVLLPVATAWQKFAKKGSVNQDAADVAVATNIILLLTGLLPIPGLDGGAMLKWALVEKGETISQADEKVRRINWIAAPLLTAGGLLAFKKKNWLNAGLLSLLGGISFLVAAGQIKETSN